MPSTDTLNDLLRQWSAGNETARDNAISLLYDHLIATARRLLAQKPSNLRNLSPEALVSKLYIYLAKQKEPSWRDPLHFAAFTSKVMRQILVDSTRQSNRGYSRQRPIEEALAAGLEDESSRAQIDILSLHEALDRLERIDPRQASIVGLRFFASLSVEEVAEILGISVTTVKREWRTARLWLYRELSESKSTKLECKLFIGLSHDADAETVVSALNGFLKTLGFHETSSSASEVN